MTKLISILAAMVVLSACKRDQHGTDEAEHKTPATTEKHDHDGGEQTARVHIDAEMLRDLRITTAPVEVREGSEGITALGGLAVNENAYAEVGSPLPARIVSLSAVAGSKVAVNQPLAKLQSPELGKARAALVTARARASAATSVVERKRGLAADKIVAPRELQAAEAEAAVAAAELESARAAISALGAGTSGSSSSELILRSPIAGTVIERKALVGQMADPAQPLFRVGDLSRLWLVVQAFERDAVRIHEGSEARLSFAAFPGQTFTAKVALVGSQVDSASRTVAVRLEVDNKDETLKPGMSASAFLPVGKEGGTLKAVPAAALQRLENGWYVFLPTDEQGAFERREVGRGRTLGGEVEILSGLKEGEKVVVEGAFLLKAEFDKSRGEGEEHGH